MRRGRPLQQDAPLIRPNPDNVHSITPPEFLTTNGSLPELWFQGVEDDNLAVVKQFWFEELIKNATDAAAVTGSAEVPAGVALTLRMEGSERDYAPVETPVPVPAAPSFFSDMLTGMGSGSSSSFGSLPFAGAMPKHADVLRFLTLQHLLHHKALGFSGTIMVVMRHTADILLESAALRKAVARRRLVLVLWELGLEPRASHFMQVPAYNLLRLAAWGSNSTLALWDLDEYLVLPQHRLITEEIYGNTGCMKEFLEDEPQAIIPSMWSRSNNWMGAPEVVGWMQHGRWARAVQNMDYAMWPYTFCDGTCKAVINPTSDHLFQVHQHMTLPPRMSPHPVSWRCGYILHFYRLWTVRIPSLMTYMGYVNAPGKIPGVPLLMEDVLPHSMLVRLANMARVYAGMLALNPTLATIATPSAVGRGGVTSKAEMKRRDQTAPPPADATSPAGA
eukprot:gene13520-13645_t